MTAQDLPAPGDYTQAVERAKGLYTEAVASLLESIDALEADNLPLLRLAVDRYRRVMPILTVWHGRACWKADYEGANVAYPAQTLMGEMLGTLSMAQGFLTEEANMEELRATFVQLLHGHALMLGETIVEMLNECGAP